MKNRPSLLTCILLGSVAFLMQACDMAKKEAMSPAAESKNAAVSPDRTQALGYTSENGVPKTPAQLMERKIIRNGKLHIVVKYYEPFFTALQKNVLASGGYISQIQVTRGSAQISSAMIVLRLKPKELDRTISWLKEQGVVISEKITADDISEQYYDLKTRLSNARRFEERLLEMLKTQTGKLEDVLMVEEKLNQVREQVEQFEGKLRYFDNLVGLATLTLNISVQEKYIPPRAPGFGERAVRVWHESTASLKDFTQGAGLFGIAIVPWIIPVAILGLIVRYILKFLWKLARRRKVKSSE